MITIKSSEAATINSEFKEHTAEIKHALDGMLPLLEKDFKIERDLEVLVRPIRQSRGSYKPSRFVAPNRIEIDCRMHSLKELTRAITREMSGVGKLV